MISIALVLFRGVESIHREVKDVIEAGIRYFYDEYEMVEIPFIIPPEAINNERGQVNAEKVMDLLLDKEVFQDKDVVISFLDKDMYFKNMNFIFGLAHLNKGRIVMSTYRLTKDPSLNPVNPSLYRERIFKEVLHEIGHIFKLDHCHDKSCVMSFSSSVLEVDRKLPMFCPSCKDKIRSCI